MRNGIWRTLTILLFALAMSLAGSKEAHAQSAMQTRPRPDLAIDYSVLRSNAPPGDCICFYGYGGSATFAWPLKLKGVALLGDLTAVRAGGISSHHYELTLATYTAGGRYAPPIRRTVLRPFADAMIGVSHANGSLVQGPNVFVPNATASFALNVGGGLDVKVSPHLSLRLGEVDYLLTNFDNGAGNRQNILRLSAGGVYRF